MPENWPRCPLSLESGPLILGPTLESQWGAHIAQERVAKDRFLVKVIPPRGYSIYRFEFTRRHVAGFLAIVIAIGVVVATYYLRALYLERGRIAELQRVASAQRERLKTIDHATDALSRQLQQLRAQNDLIRRTIGIETPARPKRGSGAAHGLGGNSPGDAAAAKRAKQTSAVALPSFTHVQDRIATLTRDSKKTREDTVRLRALAMRILNVRHMEQITRARLIAAIPSINPTFGASVISGFGYRTDPAPEFHQGVDLDANYGDTVRAAATGVVVLASWDGGYGIKVDIDHENGYHTWYAHLSKTLVTVGQHVVKGQPIALVGSTGYSTGPHLHYQVMHDGIAINPAPFLTGIPQNVLASLK